MKNGLVLSVFPGIDLLGRGFEEAGYCVVRGPDILWGGDIGNFHPPSQVFEGVIGGPPCKSHSLAVKGHQPTQPNLIPQFERIVEAARPDWFLMENVKRAPRPSPRDYQVQVLDLDAKDFMHLQDRPRRFWFGSEDGRRIEVSPIGEWPLGRFPCITATEYKGCASDPRRASRKVKRKLTLPEVAVAFGLPPDFDMPGFRLQAKYEVLGNAVPVWMAKAIALAVRGAFP